MSDDSVLHSNKPIKKHINKINNCVNRRVDN